MVFRNGHRHPFPSPNRKAGGLRFQERSRFWWTNPSFCCFCGHFLGLPSGLIWTPPRNRSLLKGSDGLPGMFWFHVYFWAGRVARICTNLAFPRRSRLFFCLPRVASTKHRLGKLKMSFLWVMLGEINREPCFFEGPILLQKGTKVSRRGCFPTQRVS